MIPTHLHRTTLPTYHWQAPSTYDWQESSVERPFNQKTFTFSTTSTPYLPIFDAILNRTKTIDARLNYANLDKKLNGSCVIFSHKKAEFNYLCKVTAVRNYETIDAMFKSEDWRKIFPFFNNQDQAFINQRTFFNTAINKRPNERYKNIVAIEFVFLEKIPISPSQNQATVPR